jgi:hypothetical protein
MNLFDKKKYQIKKISNIKSIFQIKKIPNFHLGFSILFTQVHLTSAV